jgi:pimeloyl-ACP methyl ester carboxylesterase
MTLRHGGAVLDETLLDSLPSPSGKILLLVHGLCMNDLQCRREVDGQIVDHGRTVADELGYTPIYLRYNSGLPIAHNAASLAAELENLLTIWPVKIEELTIVAHSMGGLLARHAVHQAAQAEMQWPKRLNNVVFLGTPHHGAPLEKASAWIQSLLGATPYSAPFVRLSGLRSAGMTDLRHGCTAEELPFTAGINWYSVAATTAAQRGLLADHLTGDGLVPLRSALGEGSQASNSLPFAKGNTLEVYGTNHMALLSNSQVLEQLLKWLN